MLILTSASYAATKWRRMHAGMCIADDTNSEAGISGFSLNGFFASAVACPWVSGNDFDAAEVNEVDLDLIGGNSPGAPMSYQMCVTFDGSDNGSCSTQFFVGAGFNHIAITDAASLNVWRNNPAMYPFIRVVTSNGSGNQVLGYKVLK